MARRYTFAVEQGGIIVASGDAPTDAAITREGMRYWSQYRVDGPATLTIKKGRDITFQAHGCQTPSPQSSK